MARALLGEPVSYTILNSSAIEAGTSSANLLNDEPGLVCRANATGAFFIEVDLGAAVPIGAMAWLGQVVAAGTNRWRGATSQANLTASPGYDSGSVAQIGYSTNRTATLAKVACFPATDQTFRYWRLDIAPTGIKAEAWRLIFCRRMRPVENIQIGAEFSVDDRSVRRYARSGRRIIDPTAILPAFQGEWPWITRTEYQTQWRPFMLRSGATLPAFFVLDSDDTTYGEDAMIYGDLEKSSKIVYGDGDTYGYNLAIVAIAP